MSVKVRFVKTAVETVPVRVYRPSWREFLQY